MEIVYNAWGKNGISDDLQNLEMALRFVEDEYIGGCGSRGYGKVDFAVDSLEWTSIDHYRHAQKGDAKDTNRKSWLHDAGGLLGLVTTAGTK